MLSAVNVALPAIQAEFSVNAVLLSWIPTAYVLAAAVCLVPIGRVADIAGRKRIFLWGLYLFTLSSLLSAWVLSVHWLIFLRVLQGFGMAMVATTGMAMLTSVVAPVRRGRSIGIYVAAVYIGLSVGPFAGGLITEYGGWRYIFIAPVPVSVAAVVVTHRFIRKEWAGAAGETFDVAGSLIYGAALLMLVWGASLLPDLKAICLVGLGCLGLVLFVKKQSQAAHPVFDVRLFTDNRLFAYSSFAALIHYAATFAITFLISLFLQYIKGLSPKDAGFILMAQPVFQAVFSPQAGRLSDRIEPRFPASAGMALTALGLLFLVFIDQETSMLWIGFDLALLGFGFALFSSPNMNAIMGAVEKKNYGLASGTVATMRLLGQMCSMAIATVVFALFIGKTEITPSNYGAFMTSMKITLLIFIVLCTVGIFFSMARGTLREKPPAATGGPNGTKGPSEEGN